MYTIQQLQAADFILKKILKNNDFPFKESELKLVIELNGTYWYGDFLNIKDRSPIQYFIEDDGGVDYTRLYAEGNNATLIFKKIQDTYSKEAIRPNFYTNPFRKITTIDLLFNTIFKLIKLADIQPDDSPIYPYLLNAKSLDGRLELPFINIDSEKVKVISLIEVPNQN